MYEHRVNASENEPLLRQPRDASSSAETTDDVVASSIDEAIDGRSLDLGDKLRVLAVLFAFFCSGMTITVVGVSCPPRSTNVDSIY